jgi:hypothetical protein
LGIPIRENAFATETSAVSSRIGEEEVMKAIASDFY